jgi:putative oxidoreductase
MIDRLNACATRMLSILRIVTGLLFMQHGLQKLVGFPPSDHGATQLMSIMGVGGAIELVGGALIILGLFTRASAFICSGEMAVAYFMFHLAGGAGKPGGFFPAVNGGDLAIMFCFVFLYFVFAGPGPWSLDAQMRKRP